MSGQGEVEAHWRAIGTFMLGAAFAMVVGVIVAGVIAANT